MSDTRQLSTPPADPPPQRGQRQAIRLNSFSEVVALAHGLYAAGCCPRNVDRPEKLIPILLTGAELGLGPMASIKYVTPPVNGACSLWGDMGLALVRASGQLAKFEERIEGEGDDRKGVCVIQRTGYPVKSFEYAMGLAKKLKSYQFAYKVDAKSGKVGGGPWYDDPDNMLMWRARWRAIRSEFTDVLNGMTGAEEQEDAITVEATVTSEAAPALPPAPPAALPPPSAVPPETLKELSRLKSLMREQYPDSVEIKWAEYLSLLNVRTARDLTAPQAEAMCEAFGRQCDPFTYPPPSAAVPPPQATEAAGQAA